MILLEKIIAQAQIDNHSYALVSERRRNENPMLSITQNGQQFTWTLTGLRSGEVQQIPAENPRANHVAIYIGMDDLVNQIDIFPHTDADLVGLVDGLRIPAGTERAGGVAIRWNGAVTRVEIADFDIIIPPIRLLRNPDDQPTLNVDRESSPYPIERGPNRTIRELHFGIDHDFILRRDGRINIGRIEFVLEEGEYATVLEAIRNSVEFHTRT